jgi:ABC-type sugar transport system ATPase subunit
MSDTQNTESVILDMHNIFKNYEGVRALSDVHLNLRRGEVHALVGENGAGKSTLVRIIMGVIRPDSGTIEFAGEPVRISNPHIAQGLGIAAIFQEASLFPDLSVAENIFVGHEPMNKFGGIDWHKMNELAKVPLKELGVNLDVKRKILGLSIAQRQMRKY